MVSGVSVSAGPDPSRDVRYPPEDAMMGSRVRVHRKSGTAYEVKYFPLHDEFVKGSHHFFNAGLVTPKVKDTEGCSPFYVLVRFSRDFLMEM